MDLPNISQGINGFMSETWGVDPTTAWTVMLVFLGIALLGHIVQALLVGALARGKGYSFFGNFLLGLFFGVFALIYEAGRPVSYERECVMQDRLALQVAKELYKLQRARDKAGMQSRSIDNRAQ